MNTQELIQEYISEEQRSNLIPIEEFMPKWTTLKEKSGDDHQITKQEEVEMGISYVDGSRCLIGEAHGFGNDINYNGCGDCNNFSYGYIDDNAGKARRGNVRDFYAFKERVYNHFLELHPEKLLRK
ncbi:MAG TPA: hypothetical protein ENI23_12855 [bacterium]|nr:hypothetical protein [bacterium]